MLYTEYFCLCFKFRKHLQLLKIKGREIHQSSCCKFQKCFETLQASFFLYHVLLQFQLL